MKDCKTNILIIEDEVMIAEDLAETLRSYGYDALEPAFSPGDGLQKIQNNKVDLVLLDINLESEINGIEIAQYINENARIPFIYITSYSDPDTIAEARSTKPMGYITKPFKKADIFATIEIALQNFQRLQSSGFPSLDTINRHLIQHMTQREYELLSHIYSGRSNNELSDLFNISLNTVKTHLKNCYAKLGVNSRVAALSKTKTWI